MKVSDIVLAQIKEHHLRRDGYARIIGMARVEYLDARQSFHQQYQPKSPELFLAIGAAQIELEEIESKQHDKINKSRREEEDIATKELIRLVGESVFNAISMSINPDTGEVLQLIGGKWKPLDDPAELGAA